MKNIFDINPESCYIELKPDLTPEKEWTGQVEIHIVTSKNNPMEAKSRLALIHLCQLVASSVALMEQDYEFADRLEEFYNEKDAPCSLNNKKEVDIVQGEGNIVHISFASKTKGTA